MVGVHGFRIESAQVRAISVLLLLLGACPPPAISEELTPEQVLRLRRLSDLQISPDGGRVAFTVEEPVQGAEQTSDVWVLDVKTREARRFTRSPKSDRHPRWSPDGKYLAFLSDRDGLARIHLLLLEGGEARVLPTGKSAVRSFEWSPDGKQMAFIAPEPKTDERDKREKEGDDARVVDKDDERPQLSVVDVETGQVRQLTRAEWRVSELAWIPGEERLLVSATDHLQPELLTNRIYSVRAADGKMDEVAHPTGPFSQLGVSPDGKWLAYLGSRVDGPSPHDLFVLPLFGGSSRNLTGTTLDRPVLAFHWQRDGSLLVLAETGFTNTLFSVTQDGKATRLEGLEVPPWSFAVGPGIVAFVGESATKAPEIWISSGRGRAEPCTDLNREWSRLSLIEPEILRYRSFDGTEIEAGLLKPAGYQDGKRVPSILLVHGGPSGRWADRFDSLGQLLASRGFAVFYPNVRGSTGYGHPFLEMNRRDWGGGDFKDVMTGADYLIERGIADPERLGIGGWSYGGYMAAWAVTQNERFRVAVSGAPMTDLASEYGTETSSINAYDTWYLGTPYETPEIFAERSPVTHVKKARTPTLILCGEKDVTDPIGQCEQFYRGLKRYGVETDLVVYPREGHGLREEKHQVDRLRRTVEWFSKYLK